jgi:hypothetical protein
LRIAADSLILGLDTVADKTEGGVEELDLERMNLKVRHLDAPDRVLLVGGGLLERQSH